MSHLRPRHRSGGHERLPKLLLIVLGACFSLPSSAGPPYAGRSLHEVLTDLESQGLQLIYNDRLVPAGLNVAAEPAPGRPEEVLTRLLAPHGLSARRIAPGVYAIVETAAIPAAPPAAVRTGLPRQPLEEIVVSSSRYRLATQVPDPHTFFTREEMQSLPRLGEDSMKIVQRLPAAASNGLSGLAHMRGGEGNESRIVLDGLTLYEPFHLRLLQSPVSVLNASIVDNLDVHVGGFTAEFGESMSAVIDTQSIRPDADAYYELGLSLLHAEALAAQRFASGRGQWLAAIRRSNLEEVADILDSDIGEPSYLDGFARIDYELAPGTRGSLQALLSTDRVRANNSAETEFAEAEYRNGYLWATLERDWESQLHGRAILSYTDVSSRREGVVEEPGGSIGTVDDRRDYDVLGLRLDGSWLRGRWLHRFGLEARSLSAIYDYTSYLRVAPDRPLPGSPGMLLERQLQPAPSGERYGAYLSSRLGITEGLTGELGLRWDQQSFSDEGDGLLSPRLNLLWQVSEATRLRASWGRFRQLQGIEELQVEEGIEEFLPAQFADHMVLGLETELPWQLSARVEAYRKDYGNLKPRYESLFDPLSLVPELRWDRVRIAPSGARAEGVELLVARRSDQPWNGWLSYAWSRVDDRLDGTDIARSWDQTHSIGGGITWASGAWQASVAASYHTGWPVTDLSRSEGDEPTTPPRGERNGSRYADFASVDLRISRDFELRRGTLSAFAEMTNALDRRNPCCTDFVIETAPDGSSEVRREYRHWLPLVPSVGLVWRY
ncbi:MAG TPA: TonB-dependent receptor [Steroidobacteraceae bacterium]|nr:TonB-dependent receptor [Steroidobacteraceae bacterium]